jgi:DNA-binding HxlR family transcriptional regulator
VPRVCSITDALALVGERYSLLVVREIRYGRTRFTQLLNGTGAPRDVLARRLRELEEAGIIERRPYSERPPRHEYLLTEAGMELHPVLLQLKEWGDRHCNPGAEPVIFRHACGAEFHATTVCQVCRKPIAAGDLEVSGGTHPVDATL